MVVTEKKFGGASLRLFCQNVVFFPALDFCLQMPFGAPVAGNAVLLTD